MSSGSDPARFHTDLKNGFQEGWQRHEKSRNFSSAPLPVPHHSLLAKDTAHRQLSTIQDYYETPEDSVRIDTAKAIGKFLSRSGKSDSESKVTISLADEDFAKKLEEVASDSAGKQMLEFAIAMYEKNNSGK